MPGVHVICQVCTSKTLASQGIYWSKRNIQWSIPQKELHKNNVKKITEKQTNKNSNNKTYTEKKNNMCSRLV